MVTVEARLLSSVTATAEGTQEEGTRQVQKQRREMRPSGGAEEPGEATPGTGRREPAGRKVPESRRQ